MLVFAEVEGQTQEKYGSMMTVLGPVIRRAEGFIADGAGPTAGGWRTFEVWESQAHAARFFATHVHPNLPAGVKPKRTLVELHCLMLATDASDGAGADTVATGQQEQDSL